MLIVRGAKLPGAPIGIKLERDCELAHFARHRAVASGIIYRRREVPTRHSLARGGPPIGKEPKSSNRSDSPGRAWRRSRTVMNASTVLRAWFAITRPRSWSDVR